MSYGEIKALRSLVKHWFDVLFNPARVNFEIAEQLDAKMRRDEAEVEQRSDPLERGRSLFSEETCLSCRYFSRDGDRSGLPCAVEPYGLVDNRCQSFESLESEVC